MKHLFYRNQTLNVLLILFLLIFVNTKIQASELEVIVPWAEDTTYHECASDIPPLIEPTASSSCGGGGFHTIYSNLVWGMYQ